MEVTGCTVSATCQRHGRCLSCVQVSHGEKMQHGTLGLVAMTSAQHAGGRQFDPGRVYCGRITGVLPEAWSGSRRQVAALAASQATGIDIQTAAVLQRADAASRPEQDSNEPARHPPAPWADAAAICGWGVLGLGHQTDARHLLRAGTIARVAAMM